MVATLFHGSHISLVKWLWAIYFLSSDKDSISALRLSKLIEVNWRTVRLILKTRHIDSLYQLRGTIELDDALISGRQKGKRGRDAKGKTSMLIACESSEKKQGLSLWKRSVVYATYSVNEFSYRFNRRFVEQQIPNRLLNLAIIHAPVKTA